LPPLSGRLYLPQLTQPVTIHTDKWGIPHIHAASRQDLLLAQGFSHAQDRLWQMELNRRAAKGELCALLGPIPLETDRLARTLGFARLAHASWQHLDKPYRRDLEAYSVGVNAFIETQRHLPLEFSLLRHRPRPWQPLDSLAYARLQMWALTHGAFGEIIKAQLIEQVGPEKAAVLCTNYPPEHPTTLPQGIEVSGLRLDGLGGTAVPWIHPFLGKGSLDGAGRGSNGWVIGPERSASGHALLANDMHLPVGTPSLWHVQHLRSDDGLHVTGFTQPGIPYVLVGHNENIAWGATLAYTDCEDLFIEKMHPENGRLYRFQDQWQPAEVIEETIEIRGRSAHTETVIVTRHGPLIGHFLDAGETAVAYSSTALTPRATIDGFARLNTATNWDAFVYAVATIEAPSLNLLYADIRDNIGHYVSGRVPIRTEGDGSVPVPGWTGQHEWQGMIPFAEMPHALNPSQGYIVSANHRLVGPDYPHYLGQVWRNGYRAQRVEQLIQSQTKISTDDSRRFQTDFKHLPGLQLITLLADFETADPDASLSLSLLHQWDGWLGPDSIGGTVYQVLVQQLAQAILASHLAEPFRQRLLGMGINAFLHPVNEFQGYWTVSLLRILADAQSDWLPVGPERDTLLEKCLAQTTAVCRQRLGPDPDQWQWGRLHRVRFTHALGQTPLLAQIFDQGPVPIGGDGNTVAQTGFRPDVPYDNNGISISSRFVIDMGNVAQAEAMHVPGQSGNFGSPHYGDLIQPWLKGELFPLAWTTEQVTAVCQQTLTLAPLLQ